jgi:hypothetical protein
MSQRKSSKKEIAMSRSVREKIAAMLSPVNNYLSGVRDTLNVPADWVMINEQGIPSAFVPPDEGKAKA